jgi:hypothetical protein
MQEISSVSFSGVFSLRDGVGEEEFLPRLHAFLQHFVDMGFATRYRITRREALEGFGKTLPAFTYRGELIYPNLEREQAAYQYVTTRRAGARAACRDELTGQTRRGLLRGDADRIARRSFSQRRWMKFWTMIDGEAA